MFSLRCSTAEWRINTDLISPEFEVLEPGRIELDRNLGTDPYQVQERFMGDIFQNPIAEDVEGFGKVAAEKFYIQSLMHSDYDSAESIANSDLEDGKLRKMLRGVSAKRTQADRRGSLMLSSSQETRASG